jgi:hypothetical protein
MEGRVKILVFFFFAWAMLSASSNALGQTAAGRILGTVSELPTIAAK